MWAACARAVTTEISNLSGVTAVEIDMVASYEQAGV
jgi:copper chaperone CopZ